MTTTTGEPPLLSKVQDLFRPELSEPASDKDMAKLAQSGKYVFQPMYEGIRCIGYRDNVKYHLRDREYREVSVYFPEICEALERLPNEILIDGIICFFPDGDTSRPSNLKAVKDRLGIKKMEDRLIRGQVLPCTFVAIDLITLGGQMLTGEPLQQRIDLLANLPVFSPPCSTSYADFAKKLKSDGWPGVMARQVESTYKLMFRSNEWRKHRF